MMKAAALILFCLIAYLGYDIYYGRNGILQYQAIETELGRAASRAEALSKRNQALQDEVNDLNQGNLAVEELARSEMGLIKEGETFYRVISPAEAK